MNAGVFGPATSIAGAVNGLLGKPVPVPMPNPAAYPATGSGRPLLWLDSSDSSTVFADSNGNTAATFGGTVGRLEDKSGNCRHMVQASSGTRPTYLANVIGGMKGIRFSTATSLGNALDSKRYLDKELTYIMACVPKTGSNGSHLVAGGPLSTCGVRSFGVTTTAIGFGCYNADAPNSASVFTIDKMAVVGVTVTSSFLVHKWYSGSIIQTAQLAYTNTQFSGLYLNGLAGTSFRSAFDFCEALVFGRRLGDDEMKYLMLSMMTKWGA